MYCSNERVHRNPGFKPRLHRRQSAEDLRLSVFLRRRFLQSAPSPNDPNPRADLPGNIPSRARHTDRQATASPALPLSFRNPPTSTDTLLTSNQTDTVLPPPAMLEVLEASGSQGVRALPGQSVMHVMAVSQSVCMLACRLLPPLVRPAPRHALRLTRITRPSPALSHVQGCLPAAATRRCSSSRGRSELE